MRETSVVQPPADLVQRVGVAMVRVHQNVDCKDQSRQRRRAVGVDQDLRDSYDAPWCEGIKGLLQQQAAALFTLAMQDVPCGGDRVSAAKIRFEQVAFHETETVRHN